MDDNTFTIFNTDSVSTKTFAFIPIDSVFTEVKKDSFIDICDRYIGKDSYANFIATITLIITLIIFIIQTCKSNKDKKENIKKNWYLTVIVQPNLNDINKFHEETSQELEHEIKRLKRNNYRNIILEKAKSIRKLQNIKTRFFNSFVTVVQSYNSSLANEVDGVLNELQDKNAIWIDHYRENNLDSCKRIVYDNKAELIGILYQGISQNKKPS